MLGVDILKMAFTLIELLIVVAIIGILAAIAVPNFLNAQLRAKIASVQADFRTLIQAADMYQIDWGRYPLDGGYISNRTESPNVGYRGLSTPIAYINSLAVARDTFAHKEFRKKDGNDWDQFYEFGFSDAKNGHVDPAKKRDRYFIESVGPDGMDSIQNTRTYPSKPGSFMAFHPSNGLSSKGDLYNAGGAGIPDWLPSQHSP